MVSTKDWKAQRQHQTNIDFCKTLATHVETWCELQGLEVNALSMAAFMVKHNLVKQSMINRYMVVNMYPDYLESEGGKERAVFAMSNKLPLEHGAIWSILAHHYVYFRPNRFDFP
jgi:hypothetical protein